MVDVGSKQVSDRRAVARAVVRMASETLDAVRRGDAPKGDVVGDRAYCRHPWRPSARRT